MFKKIFNNITSFIGEMLNKFSRTTAVTVMSDIITAVLVFIVDVYMVVIDTPLNDMINKFSLMVERVYYILVRNPYGYDRLLKILPTNIFRSILTVWLPIIAGYIILVNPYLPIIVGLPVYVLTIWVGAFNLDYNDKYLWARTYAAKRVNNTKYSDIMKDPFKYQHDIDYLDDIDITACSKEELRSLSKEASIKWNRMNETDFVHNDYFNAMWSDMFYRPLSKSDQMEIRVSLVNMLKEYSISDNDRKLVLLFKILDTLREGRSVSDMNYALSVLNFRKDTTPDGHPIYQIIYQTLHNGVNGNSYVRDEFIRQISNKLPDSWNDEFLRNV